MKNLKSLNKYVELNIEIFHKRRIESLNTLKLSDILKRKNPYLFKAKNVLTASDIVKSILDAHITSNEEGIFGDFLEGLAIYVNNIVYGGIKSSSKGIDLEFRKDNVHFIVSIKSGPNWGNKSQIDKMISDFQSATKTLRTSNSRLNIIPVNGCCYGKTKQSFQKGIYYKYCGQEFWEFISGDEKLFIKLIEPIGHKAKEKNEDYQYLYSKRLNLFTLDFANEYCKKDGSINWEKIIIMNSGKVN